MQVHQLLREEKNSMDPVTLFVIAILCVLVGYVTGILIGSTRKENPKPHSDLGLGVSSSAANAGEAQTGGVPIELVHIFRNQAGAPLSIRIGDQKWDHASQVPTAQLIALDGLVKEFQRWLKPQETPAPSPDPVQPPAKEAQPVPLLVIPPPAASASTSTKSPFIEAKTIVAQIDEILQQMLLASPMANRKIRLIEQPNQGVVVLVDQDQYPGIDAVPDAEIRSLIRQAVSTWEVHAV
jgi:hypothetical protein